MEDVRFTFSKRCAYPPGRTTYNVPRITQCKKYPVNAIPTPNKTAINFLRLNL